MSILELWHGKRIEAISKKKKNQLQLYLWNEKCAKESGDHPLIESDGDFFEWKGIFNSYNFFDMSWQEGINKVRYSRDLEKDWPNIFKSRAIQESIRDGNAWISAGQDGREVVGGNFFSGVLHGENTYGGIRRAIDAVEMIIDVDPTGQDAAKYSDWLAKSYIKYAWHAEDAEDTKNIMALYHHLDKNGIIDKADKRFDEFRSPQEIDKHLSDYYPKHYKRDRGATLDKRIEGLDISEGGEDGELVYQDEQYDIIQSNSAKGLNALGNGTRWCTRGDYDTDGSTAQSYLDDGKMYTLFKDKAPYFQWHFGEDIQVMDIYDVEINDEGDYKEIGQFLNNTAARDPESAFNWLMDQGSSNYGGKYDWSYFPKELFDAVGKSDLLTEKLVNNTGIDPLPHLEPYIAKDSLLALTYAGNRFEAPSPMIEKAISENEPEEIEDYLWKMNEYTFKEIHDVNATIDDRIGGYRGGERADHDIVRIPAIEKLIDPDGDYMFSLKFALEEIERLKQYLANETHEQYMERFKKERPDEWEAAMAEQQADEQYDLAAQQLQNPDQFSETL